jgi:hypothetical protein
MNCERFPKYSVSRAGFTLFELLAMVIGILIISLFAINFLRSKAVYRKTHCVNILKKLPPPGTNTRTTSLPGTESEQPLPN